MTRHDPLLKQQRPGDGQLAAAHVTLSPEYVPPEARHAACVRTSHPPADAQHAPDGRGGQLAAAQVWPSPW
jgi:hypothetical protein